jgi:hypothetical protein
MIRPGRADMQNTRSARNTASRRSCVTRMTVTPRCACRSRITHHSSSRVNASSAPKGSSSIKSFGSWISERQSEARCCMPPDSCQGNFDPMPLRPTVSSSPSARATYSALFARNRERCGCTISSGSSRFSSVVRQGSITGFWKAMPVILIGSTTWLPATMTVPDFGRCSPVASFIIVDLPQPDGPTMAANSPSRTFSDRPSTAGAPTPPP